MLKWPKFEKTWGRAQELPIDRTIGRLNNMDKYECTVCGYVYDPEQGDADSGVAPGTSFEALPADWVCPVCGAGKEDFIKVEA